MELRHLKYFLAVAETQNLRLAAQKVHVTQPALSRKIKEIEEELGLQLFDRLPKGLHLNRTGKFYQKQLGGIIRQIDDANERVRQFTHTERGSLTLGAPDFVLWQGEVNQSIRQFRHRYHDVELEMYSDTPIVLQKRLELDQIDGAFLYHYAELPPEYSVQPIAQDKLVLAYPASWESSITSSLSIEKLNQFPAVRLPRSVDPYYYDWLEQLFSRIHWAPNTVEWAHGESTMLGLVASGSGVAIVNERHFSRPSTMIQYTSLEQLPDTSPLSFVYKNTSDNPMLMRFLQLLTN